MSALLEARIFAAGWAFGCATGIGVVIGGLGLVTLALVAQNERGRR